MKNRILIFFPHNIFINSAGCHSRCWSLIDFFQKLNFDIIFFSFSECDVYPWNEKDISLASQYFYKSVIVSKADDYKNIFLNLSKDNDISHVLINYYGYTNLIYDSYFDKVIKICEIHDLAEHNSYMYNKVSVLLEDGFNPSSKLKKLHTYSNKEILNYNFVSNKEISEVQISGIKELKRYNLVLCISDFENQVLKKNAIKNSIYFTYSKNDENCIPKKTRYFTDPIFIASINPFNLQSYFAMRDVIQPSYKINIIGNIAEYIDRSQMFNVFGRVNDLSFFYKQTKFSLCPIVAGTGTKIKLIESMLNFTPVVCTDFSAIGTPLIDGENGYISSNWDDFRSKSNELYDNNELLIKFGMAAKESVMEYISFERNKEKIMEFI